MSKLATPTPGVPFPPPDAKLLQSPLWWLDRARAEAVGISDASLKHQIRLATGILSARTGDEAAYRNVVKELRAGAGDRRSTTDRLLVTMFVVRQFAHDGRLEAARKVATDSFADHRNHAVLLGAVALGQMERNNVAGARETLQALGEQDRQVADRMLIGAWAKAGDFDEAQRIVESLRSESVKSDYYRFLIHTAALKGDVKRAFALCEKVDAPDLPDTYQDIASGLVNAGDEAGAMAVADRVPADACRGVLAAIAFRQLEKNEVEKAEKTAALAHIQNDASDYARRRILAQVRANDIPGACATAGRAFKAGADFSLVFSGVLKTGNMDAAKALLDAVPEGESRAKPFFQMQLAEALSQKGKFAEAMKLYDEVVKSGRHALVSSFARMAAPMLEAHEQAMYDGVRKPLVDVVAAPADDASRRSAREKLATFDYESGNMTVADAEFKEWPDVPQDYERIVQTSRALAGGDLPLAANTVRFRASTDELWEAKLASAAAGAYCRAGKRSELVAWIPTLPTAAQRAAAYLRAAEELLPADEEYDRYRGPRMEPEH